MGAASRLSRTTAEVTLPGDTVAVVPLFQATAGCADWRLIEASGERPFDLEVGWAAAGARGQTLTCTVSRSAQVCVYASSLDLRVRNRAAAENPVAVLVADAFLATANVHQTEGLATASRDQALAVAAVSLRLELANPDGLPQARLRLLDPDGAVRADIAAADQPADGVTVGGAASVQIVSPQSPWRLLTFLHR